MSLFHLTVTNEIFLQLSFKNVFTSFRNNQYTITGVIDLKIDLKIILLDTIIFMFVHGCICSFSQFNYLSAYLSGHDFCIDSVFDLRIVGILAMGEQNRITRNTEQHHKNKVKTHFQSREDIS